MGAEFFHPNLTCQLQESVQYQELDPNLLSESDPSWMWSNSTKRKAQGMVEDVITEDDSWEVRAFAEDANNATWPPRSYTCIFCRREFRSAQALGGHMNVHRRDRARLHQNQYQYQNNYSMGIDNSNAYSSCSTLKIPTQECVANGGGLCFLYNKTYDIEETILTPKLMSNAPSTLLSIAPYQSTNMVLSPPALPLLSNIYSIPQGSSTLFDEETTTNTTTTSSGGDSVTEELDLELRLGH